MQDAFASGVGKRDNGDGHHDVFAAEKVNVAASAGRKGKNKYFPIHFVIHKIYFWGDFFVRCFFLKYTTFFSFSQNVLDKKSFSTLSKSFFISLKYT